SASVTTPSWTTRLSLRSIGSTSPRFSFHNRINAASSGFMMIRASDPPTKSRRSGFIECEPVTRSLSVNIIEIFSLRPAIAVIGFNDTCKGVKHTVIGTNAPVCCQEASVIFPPYDADSVSNGASRARLEHDRLGARGKGRGQLRKSVRNWSRLEDLDGRKATLRTGGGGR